MTNDKKLKSVELSLMMVQGVDNSSTIADSYPEGVSSMEEGKHFRKLTLTDLYPEILTHVFGYLDIREKSRVAQCCQYFNEICKNRQIWKGTEARLNLKPSQNPIYQNLSVRGITNVQVLSLKRSLRDLTSHMPIKRLKLSGCYNVTDYSLSSTVNLVNLVDLDLSLCKQITDLSLYSIAGKAKNLQSLDLGGCCNLTDRGILLISYGLRKLVKLDLRSCYSLTDRALAYLSGEVQIHEPKTFNFLAKVGLIENPNCVICKRGSGGGSSSRSSNKVVLPKIDEFTKFGMLNLQTLVLQDCQKISDVSLEHISRIESIQSLNLSFCVNITDNGLKHLKKLPKLSEVNLRSCDNITDTALINLKDCPNIQHLDVSFCEKICTLNYHLCKHLRTLSLSACDISDSAVMAVDLTTLETLNLGQCRKITDLGLRAIAEKCSRLKYIDLYGCSGVTTKGIEVIMRLGTLKHVNLGLWKV